MSVAQQFLEQEEDDEDRLIQRIIASGVAEDDEEALAAAVDKFEQRQGSHRSCWLHNDTVDLVSQHHSWMRYNSTYVRVIFWRPRHKRPFASVLRCRRCTSRTLLCWMAL